MKNNSEYTGLEIAIVGISCRFPGAKNWREYWDNLANGVESIDFYSDEELDEMGVDFNDANNENFVRLKSCLKDKDLFDSNFFEYRPEEAQLMNPAIRIIHECLWESIEDAGYNPYQMKGSTGLFVGGGDDLNWRLYSNLINQNKIVDDFTLNYLTNKDFLATTLAYKFNFKGTAIDLNTACSTSLVAVNLACKSLLLGENRVAIAGGVSIFTNTQKGYFHQEGMIYSKDGHCRTFDKESSGTIPAEGAGLVVLKRLKDAIADNDNIFAVIKGSASNNDGNRKVGYTAPSIEGQTECILKAHSFARINPESISYVEAHGTATALGDPIEISALNTAFKSEKKEKHHCAIGSVKSNFGHLDSAAGIAGLIKVALSLKYKKIPPSLNYNEANPSIDFNSGPFYVNTKLSKWENEMQEPLRAAVSSFGIGGTNAHVVLEEAPINVLNKENSKSNLLNISAKTQESLIRTTTNLKQFIENNENINYSDLEYTLNVGRKHFEYRKSLLFTDEEDLLLKLSESDQTGQRIVDRDYSIVFMFSGAGSQYENMGKDLYENETFFKNEMDKGFSVLKKITGIDYKNILYADSKEESKVNDMLYTQPVIFLFEYCLAQLMMVWGVEPEFMIGHSIGEYVAACISGVFSFDDALKLVVKRGQLMNTMPKGTMVSASMTEAEGQKYLSDTVSLAAVNSYDQIVFSGESTEIDKLIEEFIKDGINYVKLITSHAGHSNTIDSILLEYEKELEKVVFNFPKKRFISNLTGKLIHENEVVSKKYWLQHMRETVRFSDGINTLLAYNGKLIFIEIGASHSLTNLLKQHQTNKQKLFSINIIRHPKVIEDDISYIKRQVGQLWSIGIDIDWTKFYSNEKRRRISLPTYSFEPVKYPAVVDPFQYISGIDTDLNRKTNGETLKDWVYFPIWKSSPFSSKNLSSDKKSYLVFSLDTSFNVSLKEELIKANNEIIEVIPGECYKKVSSKCYLINPLNLSDYKLLFKDLNNSDVLITDLVHCWSLGIEDDEVELVPDNKAINLIYFSIVNSIQSLLRSERLNELKITLITDSLHNVTGSENLKYSSSLMLGLMNALPQEYSVACANIDIVLNDLNPTLLKRVALEVQTNVNDRIVAIRNNKRWLKGYQRNLAPLVQEQSVLKKNGNYLITGGLGDVGYNLANYLIEKCEANVVLVGRKKIKSINENEKSFKRLKQLESKGSKVIYYSTDISSLNEFRDTVTHVENLIGPINGLIHTAGVTDLNYFELIEDISLEKTFEMFAPKLKGIENIYEVFKGKKIDFVWATSSLASVLGGISYGSYSAANLYLDHFITSKSYELSNWKSFQLSEMIFDEEKIKLEDARHRIGLKPIEICELFDWSLSLIDCSVVTETTTDLFERLNVTYNRKKEVYLNSVFDVNEDERAERPNLRSRFVAPETEIEKNVLTFFESFFGIKNLGIEDNFFELGGDSLKAMILLKRLNGEFEINLTIKEFFELANVKQIALSIDEKLYLLETSVKTSKIKI